MTYDEAKANIGARVVYSPMLSSREHHGVLLMVDKRSVVMRTDDGYTGVMPFIERVRLEEPNENK